jgi:hypothetical protein
MQHDDVELDIEEGGIPRFEWENRRGDKGWAEFVDPEDLSRRDIKALRKAAGSSENEGQAAHSFFDEALVILVSAWEVPGLPNARLPRHDAKGLDSIPATFSAALENHLRPHIKALTRGNSEETDEGEPGSPRRPGRG